MQCGSVTTKYARLLYLGCFSTIEPTSPHFYEHYSFKTSSNRDNTERDMGFLDTTGNAGVFIDIPDAQHPKRLRPLADKPQGIWGHAIPTPETAVTLSTGKAVIGRLRDFHFEVCTATNKRGVGCRMCNRTDTAWKFLSDRDQTNKKGQRVDFPKRVQYILPVWDYGEQRISILRGGPQLFEEMAKYTDQMGKDVRACDWQVWKTGQNKSTHYYSSRDDQSAFTVQVPSTQIDEVIKEALADSYTPLKDDELERKLLPQTVEQLKATLEKELAQGNGPVAGQLPGASEQKALPAAPEDAQLALMRAVLPGKTDDEIRQIIAGAKAVKPVNPNPAPQEFPVALPEVEPVYTGSPAAYVITQGKYAGKTIGDVQTLDPKYLQFLRANGSPQVQALAAAVINAKPTMPEAVEASVATPIPTIPPITTANGNVVKVEQPAVQVSEQEGLRTQLVHECKALVAQIKDFQGPGLSRAFIPLLKSLAGPKRLDYTNEWAIPELLTLKTKLNEKLSNVPANASVTA